LSSSSTVTTSTVATTGPIASTSATATTDVLDTTAASAGIVTLSLSIPTNEGAVVVTSTSPVFQNSSIVQQQPSIASTAQPTVEASTIKTFAELCSSVVGNQQNKQQKQQQQQQQQQQNQHNQHIATPVADSPLLISIVRNVFFYLCNYSSNQLYTRIYTIMVFKNIHFSNIMRIYSIYYKILSYTST
jgi:hypothetical protein